MVAVQKEGDEVAKARVFVRGLPFDATNEELEALFGDVGPVKECFVVKDKESSTPKGFGFVKFALKDDAITAKKKLNNSLFKGRRILVSFAQPKNKKDEKEGEEVYDEDAHVKQDTEPEAPKDVTPAPVSQSEGKNHVKHKPVAERADPITDNGRIVIVRDIPMETNKGKLKKKFCKHGKILNVDYKDEEGTLTASILYESYDSARKASMKLNNFDLEGVKLHAVVKSKDKAPSKKALLKSRLIIRNMSFQTKEAELRTLFAPHGDVVEVKMVVDQAGKPKGFGFVQYKNVFEASKAIAAINGNKLHGRPIAVDYALSKSDYEKAKTEAAAASKPEEAEPVPEKEDTDSDQEEEEAESDQEEEEEEKEDVEEGHKAKKVKLTDDTAPKAVKEHAPDVDEGKTVFIRNVGFETTEQDIKTKLSQFGHVLYVKVVVDSYTKKPRGTAFAKFMETEAAEACVKEAAEAVVVGKGTIGEGGVSVNGRTLFISLAVDRNKAAELKAENTKRFEKEDTRNLYLSWEGFIKPGTPAAEGVSEEDLKKREKSMAEKRKKLKLPTYMVSRNRLVVKNIPAHVDENELKKIFTKGAVAAGHKGSSFKKVILMRNRDDPKKMGRSLGWAFVEFTEHEPALAALRATNNNPDYFSNEKRLIVEFTVENTEAIKVQEQRKKRAGYTDEPKADKTKKHLRFKELKEKKIAERKEKQAAKGGPQAPPQPAKATDVGRKAKPAKEKTDKKPMEEGLVKTGVAGWAGQASSKVKPVKGVNDVKKTNRKDEKRGQKRSREGQEEALQGQRAKEGEVKPKKQKKGTPKTSAEDQKLDSLVHKYKMKLFGSQEGASVNTSRWFE